MTARSSSSRHPDKSSVSSTRQQSATAIRPSLVMELQSDRYRWAKTGEPAASLAEGEQAGKGHSGSTKASKKSATYHASPASDIGSRDQFTVFSAGHLAPTVATSRSCGQQGIDTLYKALFARQAHLLAVRHVQVGERGAAVQEGQHARIPHLAAATDVNCLQGRAAFWARAQRLQAQVRDAATVVEDEGVQLPRAACQGPGTRCTTS